MWPRARAVVVAVLAVLTTAGCGDRLATGMWPGPALVTLRGVLTQQPGRSVPAPIRLALVWSPHRERDFGAAAATTVGQELYSPPWPTHFAFGSHLLPPEQALSEAGNVGGEGRGADGVLVAFLDGDEDGTLTLGRASMPTADVVLGSSLVPDEKAGLSGIRLEYFEGTAPMGLQRGFNLVDSNSGVLPFSTEVGIVLTAVPSLMRLVCAETDFRDCDTPLPLRVHGSVGVTLDMSAAHLEVSDLYGAVSTATLSINAASIPWSADAGVYSLLAKQGPVRAGEMNQLVARAQGYQDFIASVSIPSMPEITAPTFGAVLPASSGVSVSWKPAAYAVHYRVLVTESSRPSATRFETQTNALVVTTPPLGFTGNGSLNVHAEGAQAGGGIFPYTTASIPVFLQP